MQFHRAARFRPGQPRLALDCRNQEDAYTFGAACQVVYDPECRLMLSCMAHVVALQILELVSSCVFRQHVVELVRGH